MKPILALFLVCSLASAGCVLKAKHDETLAKELQCEANLKAKAQDRDQLVPKLEEAKRKLADAEARNEELSQVNQLLANKNADFSKKSWDAQQELLLIKQEKEKEEGRLGSAKQAGDELAKALQTEIQDGSVQLKQSGADVSIWVPSGTLLTPAFDDTSPVGRKILEKIAAQAKKLKYKQIDVNAYGAAPPAKHRKSAHTPTSWEATAFQAAKIVQFLEGSGVDKSLLTASGRGESGGGPDGKPKIRRIEIAFSF